MEQADNKSEEQQISNTAANPDGFFANLTDGDACSVAVAVRVRPLVGRELSSGNKKLCIEENNANQNKLQMGVKSFDFDTVFWASQSQEAIFDKCTRNLVLGCFHGYNATILAYGQTGSGKTHTMGTGNTIGVPFEQVGIVPRVFKFIFDELDVRKAESEFSQFKVRISFLEIYNEELHDLLDPASMIRDKITGKPQKELSIREEKGGMIQIRGLLEKEVSSPDECGRLLNSGINHRQTSATLMNEGSSRSHAIFTITIEQKIIKEVEVEEGKEGKADGENTVTEEIVSKFHFVDLAGSERIKKTGAQGMQLKEGISINKGLLCLGQVISALTDEKRAKEHIPYRDAKLTRILQDSLGGNSRTTMIACVSPAESNYEESLSTVKYASRARNIKNKPVVNKDPNSVLIESLRGQICTLQIEVKEYVVLLQTNNINLPADVVERAMQQQQVKQQSASKPKAITSGGGGGASSQDVKDLKIKLSHKERELREAQQKLRDQQIFLDKTQKQLAEVEKEKDQLALKSEAMSEKLKTNNIEFDSNQFEGKAAATSDAGQKAGIIDQYKAKLAKARQDLDAKIKEIQEKDQKFLALKQAGERDEKILKKHMEENQKLKKQMASGGGSLRAAPSRGSSSDAAPAKRDFKSMRAARKENQSKTIEQFNQKFLSDLQGQIDSMFTTAAQNKLERQKNAGEGEAAAVEGEEAKAEEKLDESTVETAAEGEQTQDMKEKAKILAGVREYAISMSTDIKDLLKNEWAGTIQSLEGEKKKAEKDRKESLLQAKNDSAAVQAIEKEHNNKMASLNTQVAKLEREKAKKEESVAKQIAMQETRIKALEADLDRQKKKRAEVEQAQKFDQNRFYKFKQTATKDLHEEKKRITDKEKEMSKLKRDLKQVDQLAQQKIAQLRGLQKRAQDEKVNRDKLEEKELQTKGIDIDLIKDWISSNTEAMLKNQELKEYLDKQQEQKSKLEDEMLAEGDRMTEVLIQKEKLEFEKEEIESRPEGEKDEGRLLEIEDQLKDFSLEMGSIADTLDQLEEVLEFVQSKVNQVTEEINAFSMDSVTPLSFNALDNLDSARATLKIFFQVVLDLNVYKRDLENKCIEQDENVIQLTASVKTAEARVQYMIEHGGQDGYATHVAKQAAISQVMKQVDGYVDNRDVEHLNLNPKEQTNLTKLSLSKIVSNLKNKLKEQEVKNQSISLKLDQALKQKEIYKQKCDELKAQMKTQQFANQPRGGRSYTGGHSSSGTSPFGGDGSQSPGLQRKSPGLSFKDKQRLKKEQAVPPKQVESLADRRKNRKNLIGEDGVNELNSEIDKLKQANNDLMKDKNGGLEEIAEDEEEENLALGLTTVKEVDESALKESMIEPDHNLSQLMSNQKLAEQEEWSQQDFMKLNLDDSKLVDFFFLNTKMVCIFESFQVHEINIASKIVEKSYNLQEIEGFEISEELEDDRVTAFALEKDVQLLSVACLTNVHIFEYSEEEENSLTHVAKIEKADIEQLIFVGYYLVMQQNLKEQNQIQIMCYDPDSEETKVGSTIIDSSKCDKVNLQPGNECVYFGAGTELGKIEVPSMTEVFKVNTGHTKDILDMAVTQFNQIITTSQDGQIRFFNFMNGASVSAPMEEMECSHLVAQGIHLLTRIGNGEAMLVWRIQLNGGLEEMPVGEIELQEDDKIQILDFKMKSGVNQDADGQDSEGLIMMYLHDHHISFKTLTQTHLLLNQKY